MASWFDQLVNQKEQQRKADQEQQEYVDYMEKLQAKGQPDHCVLIPSCINPSGTMSIFEGTYEACDFYVKAAHYRFNNHLDAEKARGVTEQMLSLKHRPQMFIQRR